MKTWLLKKTGPLELLLAAIILVCVYFQHLQDVPFYPDESQWIATSFYFESLLGIKPSTPEWLQLYRSTSGYTNTNWAENYWTLTQPPVTRPQIAVILAVPFLFNRRRVWWWFCGGAAFLALYSLALVRFEGVRDFISLLRISAIGQGFGMNQNAMFNFTGMVLRTPSTRRYRCSACRRMGIVFSSSYRIVRLVEVFSGNPLPPDCSGCGNMRVHHTTPALP